MVQAEWFTLEFDDPMYLGMTASVSAVELRALVVNERVSHILPVIEDFGHAIHTRISNEAVSLIRLPLRIAPGITGTFNLDALRRHVA